MVLFNFLSLQNFTMSHSSGFLSDPHKPNRTYDWHIILHRPLILSHSNLIVHELKKINKYLNLNGNRNVVSQYRQRTHAH